MSRESNKLNRHIEECLWDRDEGPDAEECTDWDDDWEEDWEEDWMYLGFEMIWTPAAGARRTVPRYESEGNSD